MTISKKEIQKKRNKLIYKKSKQKNKKNVLFFEIILFLIFF